MEGNQINRIEELLGTLIKMVSDSNAILNTLEDNVKSIKGEVTSINSEFANMKDNVKEIGEDVKEVKVGQERQDRILEMLSVKSIETDSYIRDFKRNM